MSQRKPGRPEGSLTRGSLRSRIYAVLADGVPRTTYQIAQEVGEGFHRVRNAVYCAVHDGKLKRLEEQPHVRYTLPGLAYQVIPEGSGRRSWWQL